MLAVFAGISRSAPAPQFDTPTIVVGISTDDPTYYPISFPGLKPCAPNCAWYAYPMVITSDLTAQAFVVQFTYRTPDGLIHSASGTVLLHDSNGVRAGLVFVPTGTQPIRIVAVTGWLRVNQVYVNSEQQ